MRKLLTIALALALAACGGGGGGGSSSGTPAPPTPSSTFSDPTTYSSAATASLDGATEASAVTRHQLVLGGTTLNYTATAGHLTAAAPTTGAPEASFFYVAYTLDGADPATRPVTFFYNGGPGSATVWLHLGSFGPRRLATDVPSTATPAPFPLVDNAESLLDVSDLVFVDAVGCGFSEAIAPNVNRTFWGVDQDAAVFRDFVTRYLAANHRTASPKFLFGESYGTTRSAVLANLLESAGTSLDGVILQSSVLNYNSNCSVFTPSTVSCAGFLPSYAAVGAWLNLASPSPPVSALPDYMAQMRTVASTQYDPAVRAFLATHAPPDAALVAQLAGETGLGAPQWQAHFNMDSIYFHSNLVPGSVIGLYDGRMTAALGTALASGGDPSSTYIDSSFASAIVQYLGNELGYTTPSSYVLLSNAINVWNFSHDGKPLPDTIPDLAAALAHDPQLRIFSANGYHDLVTPFYVTELDFARMGSVPGLGVKIYQGGHMTYLDNVARPQEKSDLAAFYRSATTASKEFAAGASSVASVPAETRLRVGAQMPPAVMERPLLGVWVPEALRHATPAPPTRGDALEAQVEGKLRSEFDSARGEHAGELTREEARAAGLGYIVRHFDAMDVRGAGAVRFEDVKQFMRERGARLPR
jgi:carboxypeptidase C (cathepsin A)